MLKVICGEDSIAAFNYLIELKKNYIQKNYQVFDIDLDKIEEIIKWQADNQTLFSINNVFFLKNLNKKISRKQNLKINKIVDEIIENKHIEVIDFEEETQARMLKFGKKVIIKEFKPSENIFKLQDSLYPGNFKEFIIILNQLPDTVDENFIFIMLARHLKNLILVLTREIPSKLQSWQIFKLKTQAKKWDLEKLVNFYDSFYNIDFSQKTSTNPYSLKESLEILASYYL